MRVYQFFNRENGLLSLQKRQLKVSRIDQLNDPFEFLGAELSNRQRRKLLRATKVELAKHGGILCFSKTWHNPVLWGHYAAKHSGICLGFDMPTKLLRQVNYVTSRFPWPDELTESFMQQVIFSKFVHWSYEDEYRAWVNFDKTINSEFYEFSTDLVLKEVIVGATSSLSRKEIADALGDLANDVESFKVRAAFRSFRVVRNRNQNLWT